MMRCRYLAQRSTSARLMILQHFRLTGSVEATECGAADTTTTTDVHRVGIERRAAIDTDTGSGEVCRCRGQNCADDVSSATLVSTQNYERCARTPGVGPARWRSLLLARRRSHAA